MTGTISSGWLRGAAAFLMSWTMGTEAYGAEPVPNDAAREQARQLFREGNEAYRAKDLERARSLYQESIRVQRSFDAVCNLGRTEADLADDGLALLHLDECLREYPPGDAVAAAREKFYFLREEVRERCKTKDCALPKAEPAKEPSASAPELETTATKERPVTSDKESLPAAAPVVRWPVVLALGGAGVAAAAAGTVLWFVADESERVAVELREDIRASGGVCGGNPAPNCTEFLDRASAANTESTLAVVGWSLGGALLASSLLVAFVFPEDGESSSSSGVRFSPLVGGVFGGAVSGSF